MELESRKPLKLRRRHEDNAGIGSYCTGGFKSVHSLVGRDDGSQHSSAETHLHSRSPQGPEFYMVSGRRVGYGGRAPSNRHGSGQYTNSEVPPGPHWSQLPAIHCPNIPPGIHDDYCVPMEHGLGVPPVIDPRDDAVGANSMGFLVCEDGVEMEYEPAMRSLLELARENLTLKQQLKTANQELSRLQDAVQKHQSERHIRKQKQLEQEAQSRYWTGEEHHKFLEAIENFGPKDVKAIANFVGSRSATQVRTHAQKYFMKLAREKSVQSAGEADGGGASSSEATEGGSSAAPATATGRGAAGGGGGRMCKWESGSPTWSGDGGEGSSRSPPSRGSSCGRRPKSPSDASCSDASGFSGGTAFGAAPPLAAGPSAAL